jgi:hypothetical protein
MYSNTIKKMSRRERAFWKMALLLVIAQFSFLLVTIQGWLTSFN